MNASGSESDDPSGDEGKEQGDIVRWDSGPLSLAMDDVLDDRAVPLELFAMGTGEGPILEVPELGCGRGDILAFAETRGDAELPARGLLYKGRQHKCQRVSDK